LVGVEVGVAEGSDVTVAVGVGVRLGMKVAVGKVTGLEIPVVPCGVLEPV
jgi:hypothetical protein